MAEIRKLIDSWLTYAEQNGIKTTSSDGRPPEDTDLASFLGQQGLQPDQYQGLIDKIPDAPEAPEPEAAPDDIRPTNKPNIRHGKRAVASDKNRYIWTGAKWLNDENYAQAPLEIQDELSQKYDGDVEKEPEPASEPVSNPREPSDPGEPGDPTGKEQRTPLDDKGQESLEKIKSAIENLPRTQLKQLRRELTDD